MDVKGKLYQVLVNLSNLEIKGENNVLILAQSFVDLKQVIRAIEAQEKEPAVEEDNE